MKTVITHKGHTLTPGECLDCGCDDKWYVDWRDAILCICECCSECGLGLYEDHKLDCSEGFKSNVEAGKVGSSSRGV